ncbi:hypothetical protein ACFLQS_02800 [Actinomycetota bacterium]
MIGRPEWFTKRNFGFGIKPKTWQGWVYLLVAITLIVFLRWQSFWDWSEQIKNIITIVLAAVIIIDVVHIMYVLNNKDKEIK